MGLCRAGSELIFMSLSNSSLCLVVSLVIA